MIQPLMFLANNIGTNGVNSLFSNTSANSGSGSQAIRRCVWPTTGVFNNLCIVLDAAPGVGKSITCTLRTGTGAAPSNTALTVTISDGNTTGQLTGTDVNITAGDVLDLFWTSSGSPAAGTAACITLEFVPSSGNKSANTCNIQTMQTGFIGPFMMQENASLLPFQQQYVATPGDVTKLAAASMFANVNANSLDFYINKNGVRQDGTGGTVDTKCSLISVSTNVAILKSFTLPVVAGDLLYIEVVEVGTFSGNWVSCALEFTASNAGRSNLSGISDATIGSAATNYNSLSDNDALNWTTTVDGSFGMRRRGGITGFTIDALYGNVETDPGPAPNSRTFTVRVNGNDTALSGTVTTGNLSYSSTGSAQVNQGEIMSMKHVPVDSPTVTGDSTWTVALNTSVTEPRVSQVAIETLTPVTGAFASQVAVEVLSLEPPSATEFTRQFWIIG